MDAPAISTQGLTKHYGEVVALEGSRVDRVLVGEIPPVGEETAPAAVEEGATR